MKRKILISVLVISLALAAIAGGTFAWFTATADPIINNFTAGTVSLTVAEIVNYGGVVSTNMLNVNPGDCFQKVFTITNTGSKYFLLRMSFQELWEFEYQDLNPVKWSELEAQLVLEGWIDGDDGFWYYYDSIAPIDLDPDNVLEFSFDVCFDGERMDDQFQGKKYDLTINFAAIQASNNASADIWLINSVYAPESPQSGNNWDSWGAAVE